MGEIVAVAVVAHQPMVMVPEAVRLELGGTGADTTLIEPGTGGSARRSPNSASIPSSSATPTGLPPPNT